MLTRFSGCAAHVVRTRDIVRACFYESDRPVSLVNLVRHDRGEPRRERSAGAASVDAVAARRACEAACWRQRGVGGWHTRPACERPARQRASGEVAAPPESGCLSLLRWISGCLRSQWAGRCTSRGVAARGTRLPARRPSCASPCGSAKGGAGAARSSAPSPCRTLSRSRAASTTMPNVGRETSSSTRRTTKNLFRAADHSLGVRRGLDARVCSNWPRSSDSYSE